MTTTALDVVDLEVDLVSRDGRVRAVDGISFSLAAGETLAIVGESGCGKSITALSLLRLVPRPPAFVTAKAVRFAGHDLLTISDEALRRLRGDRISMIFQEPMTSLNPVLTVGRQIVETLREHRGLDAAAAQVEAVELLKLVRIPDPERRLKQYPFELSGGMRQRVMIAIAVACRPDVLIADEPTTALDVTVQAQILDLLFDLQKRIGTAVILITHDLGVVAQNARRVLVMYAGRIVEEAPVATLFARPLHPYTLGLLASMPRLAQGERKRLAEIAGTVPVLDRSATGCAFADRCAHAEPRCREQRPPLETRGPDHRVACLRVDAITRGAS